MAIGAKILSEQATRKERGKQAILPLLMLLTASLLLLVLPVPSVRANSSTSPATSPSGPDSLCGDNCPGGGGGGTCSNIIQGYVLNYDTGLGVGNIGVYIGDDNNPPVLRASGPTDNVGNFQFSGSWIQAYTKYAIEVNGFGVNLGTYTARSDYGQWVGFVTTNSNGCASIYGSIQVEPSAPVNVPGGAIFSDSQYVTLQYQTQTTTQTTVSHTESFSVEGPGISAGFGQTSSHTLSTSTGQWFGAQPTAGSVLIQKSYAATYYCNGGTNDAGWTCGSVGIISTGISGTQIGWSDSWGSTGANEYLNTASIPGCNPPSITTNCYHATSVRAANPYGPGPGGGYYTESGSVTWGVSSGVSFALQYNAFGKQIKLDTTSTTTTGTTNTVSYSISNTTDQTLCFAIYTIGATYDPTNKLGGLELHVWDLGAC